MAIIKCSICNHFYDNTTNPNCPYCTKNTNDIFDDREGLNSQKTLPLDFEDQYESNDIKTQSYFEEVDDNDKTIGVYFDEAEFNPITAWIVCIDGTVKGKCFEVHMERNFIGRDKLMDISIPDDLQISRENHLSITYDNKNFKFFAKGEKGTLIVNDKAVDCAVEIHENDVLEFGTSKYVFIPYCTNERNWNEK